MWVTSLIWVIPVNGQRSFPVGNKRGKENERRLAKFIKLWSCCCDVSTEEKVSKFLNRRILVFAVPFPAFLTIRNFCIDFLCWNSECELPATVGDGCSAVSSCTSPARSPGEQNIGGPQMLFSTLGPTDSDRRPRGNPGRLEAGYSGRFFRCSRHSSSRYSTLTSWWTIQSFSGGCSRAGRADGGPDRAVFFLWVGAPQTQFINRDVRNPVLLSTMSWAMLRINRVVELQGPG